MLIQRNGSVALIAAGFLLPSEYMRKRLHSFPHRIAVDGGLHVLHKLGLEPQYIIGDEDSTNAAMLAAYSHISRRTYARHKDHTDLELALQHVQKADRYPAPYHVFGALGRRSDHALANLHLLRRFPGQVIFEQEEEEVVALQGEVTVPCRPQQTVSLLPLAPVKAVTSQGLQWELTGSSLNYNCFSVSNKCLGTSFSLTIEGGALLCFLQRQ